MLPAVAFSRSLRLTCTCVTKCSDPDQVLLPGRVLGHSLWWSQTQTGTGLVATGDGSGCTAPSGAMPLAGLAGLTARPLNRLLKAAGRAALCGSPTLLTHTSIGRQVREHVTGG